MLRRKCLCFNFAVGTRTCALRPAAIRAGGSDLFDFHLGLEFNAAVTLGLVPGFLLFGEGTGANLALGGRWVARSA